MIPKTAWIVRSHLEYLRGGFQGYGLALGIRNMDLVPNWPFEPGALRDPGVAALLDNGGPNALGRLDRAQPALNDPDIRPKIRPFILRRSFTSIVPGRSSDSKTRKVLREVAVRILPLAEEGEKSDSGNAFYPACNWVLQSVLGDPEKAAQALSRAARCTRYDDAAFEEAHYMQNAIESQYGYQGSLLRIQTRSEVLLPEFAAMGNVARQISKTSSLNDPQRLNLLRLGELLIQTGPNRITMLVGRKLAVLAMSNGQREDPERNDPDFAQRLARFGKANPSIDVVTAGRLIKDSNFEFSEVTGMLEGSLDSRYVPYGAGVLIALACAIGLSIPNLTVPAVSLQARLRRASWAWLALAVGLFRETREGGALFYAILAIALIVSLAIMRRPWGVRPAIAVGGILCLGVLIASAAPGEATRTWLIAPAIWLASWFVPVSFYGIARCFVVPLAAYWAVGNSGYSTLVWPLIPALASFVFAIRGALPEKKNLGWLPAALALAYLAVITLEINQDAQQAAVVQRLDQDAHRFRAERGIRKPFP